MSLRICHPHEAGNFVGRALLLALLLALSTAAIAQDSTPLDDLPKAPVKRTGPPALVEYKGRRIAQTMHYLGAEWLTRDNREQEERCSLMLTSLGIKQGMTICDMGCGNGFYTLKLAKMVGPEGHLYAVDIQPEMLKFLNERADAAEISNLSPILGTFTDPRLPKGKLDLVLMVDVYHEFSHPEQMLAAIRNSLSEKGLAVLVEFRSEDPKVPIKAEHKMSKEQILKELPANGFKLVKEFDGLPWQHMMFFGRDNSWKAPTAPAAE
nr:class I SAM-dependent methyltransferase [Pirellula staleyi]